MQTNIRRFGHLAAFSATVLAVISAGDSAEARKRSFGDWGSINDRRYGFQIAYPAEVLFPVDTPSGAEGRVLQSADGKAKLLVAAFPNVEKLSIEDYRKFLLDGNYAGAKIDYSPVRDRWFVLSGERGAFTFYERVTFSCGGQLINSWAMLYPTAEKRTYDRVLETIAKTYTPGAGPDGNCGHLDAADQPNEPEASPQVGTVDE